MARRSIQIKTEVPGRFVDRRQKSDWVVRSVTIIAFVGWICAIVAFSMLDRARPATDSFFTRIFSFQVFGSWNTGLLRVSFIALLVSFLTCALGFVLNMTRHRRKTDRYNKPIIILGVLSFISLILFVIRFYAIF